MVLGSPWVFPVSCSTSLLAGVQIISAIDARSVQHGETLHSGFSVVIESGDPDNPFQVIDSDGLGMIEKQLEDTDPDDRMSFLMSRPGGQLESDTSSFSFEVIEENESGQRIEVVETYHDRDNTIWSRYEATRSTITPMFSPQRVSLFSGRRSSKHHRSDIDRYRARQAYAGRGKWANCKECFR